MGLVEGLAVVGLKGLLAVVGLLVGPAAVVVGEEVIGLVLGTVVTTAELGKGKGAGGGSGRGSGAGDGAGDGAGEGEGAGAGAGRGLGEGDVSTRLRQEGAGGAA